MCGSLRSVTIEGYFSYGDIRLDSKPTGNEQGNLLMIESKGFGRPSALWMVVLACFLVCHPVSADAPNVSTPAVTQEQLEQDWLIQAQLRYGSPAANLAGATPTDDARGGCDGVINGQWGFHTEMEQHPWWQVDLGSELAIDRIKIYNRCDGFEARAAHIQVLFSSDGQEFTTVYGHDGTSFGGYPDKRPLVVPLGGKPARYVRLQLPDKVYFHLDEVEVQAGGHEANVALHKPATQSSVSQWSVKHTKTAWVLDWPRILDQSLERGARLADALQRLGVDTQGPAAGLQAVAGEVAAWNDETPESQWKASYFRVRQIIRELAFTNPLLDFHQILFVKRAPTMFPHLSDQYYGWWARPGGGIYVLDDFRGGQGTVRCLTDSWAAGNFLRPDLSYDAAKVLVAYSRYDASIANETNKRDKANVPESVFYHLFEMDIRTGESRQLTRGKYDDFDGRYLPTGDVLFLSTRKGQFLQCTQANSQQTLAADLPDSYVRCGGDDYRPVPVFTMHAVSPDGLRIWPVSAFETFEYTPSISSDGRVFYCRWDYIDRFNGHFFSLWSSNPDGTNAQLVYGNYTVRPQATLEPRSIPGSSKIIFTGAAHHSITGGTLVLLDQAAGNEGEEPIRRLTPEVPFPETESNVGSFYANPWPLSEDFYLVSWSDHALPPHGRYEDDRNPISAQGIYLCDAFGNLELLHRDARISSMTPLPIKARPAPPVYSSPVDWSGPQVGSLLLQDVYQGLSGIERGDVKRLRIIGVVPKVQPNMNSPSLGVSHEETGKFVLGSVPVEEDGSAYFQIPSGLSVFFQALDADDMALQTMRSLVYVQPGQTLSCVGCHEPRQSTPTMQNLLAMRRGPSRIQLGPAGTWPLRFDTLVQPVLDQKCVECHQPSAADPAAARTDLTPPSAWQTLITYGDNDLSKLVFERDASIPGDNPARQSQLLQYLRTDPTHSQIALADDDMRRLAAWMDTYAQTQGAFSTEQEKQLEMFRAEYRFLFSD